MARNYYIKEIPEKLVLSLTAGNVFDGTRSTESLVVLEAFDPIKTVASQYFMYQYEEHPGISQALFLTANSLIKDSAVTHFYSQNVSQIYVLQNPENFNVYVLVALKSPFEGSLKDLELSGAMHLYINSKDVFVAVTRVAVLDKKSFLNILNGCLQTSSLELSHKFLAG